LQTTTTSTTEPSHHPDDRSTERTDVQPSTSLLPLLAGGIVSLPATPLWQIEQTYQGYKQLSPRDLKGLTITYAYAFSLLGFAEAIRRFRGYPQDFTRKVVHIGAGMWVFGVLALFETWYIGVIPFISFIALNYLAYKYRMFGAVDSDDSTPGTIYFALSIAVLFSLFWRTRTTRDLSHVAAAATMAMTWGDALASIIGRKWGKHRYTVRGDTRSFEGSAAMLIASTTAMFLTLRLLPGSTLSPNSQPLDLSTCLAGAFLGSITATVAEGVSPSGSDNLSVPLLSGMVVFGITSLTKKEH
jgi:dolichol kinase